MITTSANLRKGDTLLDGGTIESTPIEHENYYSAILAYANGSRRIRDFDKSDRPLHVRRPRGATFGPTGQGIPIEDERARAAADAYERQIGL